ncbi:SpoIIE family protein phosphatase [Streptomyces cirratus]
MVAAYPTGAAQATDPAGELAQYDTDRVINPLREHRRPVLMARVSGPDLRRIARDDNAAALLAAAGVHSYLAVPLVARGEVIGAIGLMRARTPATAPFDRGRTSPWRSNWPRGRPSVSTTPDCSRTTARRPHPPAQPAAAQPAHGSAWRSPTATSRPGPPARSAATAVRRHPLADDKTGLVIGDVMGSGIAAAATMGQLRTATRTLTQLDLDPSQVLQYLDQAAAGMEHTPSPPAPTPSTTPCAPNATSPSPVTSTGPDAPGRLPELLDLPTGAPSGSVASPSTPPGSPSPRTTSWSSTRRARGDPRPVPRRTPRPAAQPPRRPPPPPGGHLRPAPARPPPPRGPRRTWPS